MTRSRTLRSAVRLFLLASGVLLALPADPQEQQADGPIDTSLVEETGIKLMVLDVEAKDKKGNPIPGLTKDDFIVTLDGWRHPIYSVDDLCACEVRDPEADTWTVHEETPPGAADEATAREPEPVLYVMYFDFSQLDLFSRQMALDEGRRWVHHTMRPDDRVMVVAYASDPGVEVLSDFTTDKAQLLRAVDEAGDSIRFVDYFPVQYQARIEECRACCLDRDCKCDYCWRRAASDEHWHGHRSLEGLKSFLEGLDNVPGRKALLLFHERGAIFPARWYPTNQFDAGRILDQVRVMDEVAAEANLSRTAIYTVTVRSEAAGLGVNFGANLADFTGGDYNRMRTAMDTITDRAGRDCPCYYRVALQPPRASARKVFRVRVDIVGQHESHSYRVRHLREIDRWMRTARATLAYPERAKDVPLSAALVPLSCGKKGWDLRVEVALPTAALSRFRSDRRHKGRWEVGALLSRKGKRWEMLAVSELRQREDEASPTAIVHERVFRDMKPGHYELRAFVRDRWADLYGGAETEMTLPVPGRDALVGPLVLRAGSPLIRTSLPLTKKKAAENQVSSRRNVEQGALVLSERPVRAGEPLEFVTLACSPAEDRSSELRGYIALEGQPLFRLDINDSTDAGGCRRMGERLDTSPMEPGSYTYHVLWENGDDTLSAGAPFRVD